MDREPENTPQVEPESYWLRCCGYFTALLLVLLGTPVPTAAAVAWLLRLVDLDAQHVGPFLVISGYEARPVTDLWCAGPVIACGAALVLARQVPLGKRLAGVVLVSVNLFAINLLVLGLVAQLPPSEGQAIASYAWAYPLLMGFALVVTVLYWTKRVVPEKARSRHTRARLPQAVGGKATGADG